MPSPLQLELQHLRDEMAVVTNTVSRLQHRVVEITRLSEEESAEYQTRIAELETRNREFLNTAKWLRARNAELEREVDVRKPEIDKAIEARNEAIRRLRHAKRVIRDLLDEKMVFDSPDNSKYQTKKDAEIKQALDVDLNTERDSSNDSDSEKTVRLGNVASGQSQRPINLPSIESPEANSIFAGPIASSSASVHLDTQPPSPESDDSWKIHCSKPPKSSEISIGPLSWNDLSKRVGLDEDTLISLQSLEFTSEQCLRLQITNSELAFIYDPIFLESSSATYLIDWGQVAVNRNIEKYIIRNRPEEGNIIFHTFVFPVKKNNWYYVGAHAWTVSELSWSVWPTLEGKSKKMVVDKLKDRSNEKLDEQAVTQLFNSGELSQFCIQISSDSLREMSQNFGRKMGYRDRPVQARKDI